MYSKLLIKGQIEILTGMHIGGGGQFAAIGTVDSPIIRDLASDKPIIPGSSLKGKIRSLLAKQYNSTPVEYDKDDQKITRLFGAMKNPSRVVFSDMIMSNEDELIAQGIYNSTEVKFENSISRLSAVANPRQIERTIRGCKFDMDIIYNVEKGEEIVEDIALLTEGMKLLQYDYLGGHGSRGYGKLKFNNLSLEPVVGKIDEELLAECSKALMEV